MEKKHFLKEIMMDTVTQDQVDSAVVSYFENQSHNNGDTVKAMVVAGLLFVGAYTVMKSSARVVVAAYQHRKDVKKSKKSEQS
jgi:Co/Zn/Cd efflux system component